MKDLVLVGSIGVLLYLLLRKKAENQLVQPNTNTTTTPTQQAQQPIVDPNMVAYVKPGTSAPVYNSVGDTAVSGSGFGRGFVLSIPQKTYIGRTTGNFKNGFVELATTINTKTIRLWAETTDLVLITNAAYEALQNTSSILPKSDEVKIKLMTSNA